MLVIKEAGDWVGVWFVPGHHHTYRVLSGHINGLAMTIGQTGAVHRMATMAMLLAVVQYAAAAAAATAGRPTAAAARAAASPT